MKMRTITIELPDMSASIEGEKVRVRYRQMEGSGKWGFYCEMWEKGRFVPVVENLAISEVMEKTNLVRRNGCKVDYSRQ